MKVSPEWFIQLSHRVSTLHREKERFIESPGEKDRKVIEGPSEKGQGNIVITQVKGQGRYSYMYEKSPGQKIGHTTRETSHLKLEITQAFSIVDRKCR